MSSPQFCRQLDEEESELKDEGHYSAYTKNEIADI